MPMTPDELAAKMKDKGLLAEFKTQLMHKVTLTALARSQAHIPVRFGTLRRSATNRVERGGERGFIGSNVVYAPFVHEGTRFMAGRPFFALGIQDSQSKIAQLLQQAGDDYLESLT